MSNALELLDTLDIKLTLADGTTGEATITPETNKVTAADGPSAARIPDIVNAIGESLGHDGYWFNQENTNTDILDCLSYDEGTSLDQMIGALGLRRAQSDALAEYIKDGLLAEDLVYISGDLYWRHD